MKKTKSSILTGIIAAAAAVGGYFAINSNDNIVDPVDKTTGNFLFLSDFHLDAHTQPTDYGSDTGMILWNAFLTKADSAIDANDPDFIVYAGDLPAHVPYCCRPLDSLDRIAHNENMDTILTGLRDLADRHKKTLMYLPGNNDGIAGDYASFADEKGDTPLDLVPENNNPYPMVNMNATGNTPPYISSNPEPKIGYFSAVPIEGLRVIAMNTVLHSQNFFSATNTNRFTDAADQMSWLSSQLDSAKVHNEKALIALHIPPGYDAFGYKNAGKKATNWEKFDAPNDWNNQFLQILADHQPTIIGVLYGHTHMDELRRFYNPAGTAITEIGISAPGLTPNHKNNPGFKIVTYDSTTKELLDFETFYTVPSATTWGDDSYNFNNRFRYSGKKTMYENLSQDNIDSITKKLIPIFRVEHGVATYNIEPGIEVKTEQ